MTGVHLNQRGRYKCEYCDHPTWKSAVYAERHVVQKHELEMLRQDKMNLEVQLDAAEHKPPATKVVEKIVYRDKPEAKKSKFWENSPVVIFCETERIVYSHMSMPRGQTIEETPCHSCGTRTLKLVKEVR